MSSSIYDSAPFLAPTLGALFAYGVGCINSGYYLVRAKTGRDIRELGSGNAGATNVGRVLGTWGFGITVFADMAKGGLGAYLAHLAALPPPAQVLVMLAAVAGHNWPAQLGFRGGKGVAISGGALMFFDPFLTLLLLGLCAACWALTRRKTISVVLAYASLPAIAALLGYEALVVLLLGMLVVVLGLPLRHDFRQEMSARRAATAPLTFKLATEAWEFEAIHRLNYRTFVEEIPQHPPNRERRLVDRFHAENHYVIALRDRSLIGMIALRGRRPFSLDAKVRDLDRHIPPGRRPVEARLLAVEPRFRQSAVFAELIRHAAEYCRNVGFDFVVISGTTRQLKLYQHLGFVPFGTLVGSATARYQPMFLAVESFHRTAEKSRAIRAQGNQPHPRFRPLNFLPGPVLTRPEVDAAFAAPAISHRSPEFRARLDELRSRLLQLTGARHVQVLPGSGSLANAVIAAQLVLGETAGLILANGEFGERLIAEGRRARLRFDSLHLPWGRAFDLAAVHDRARCLSPGGWIWFVHHETSTGMQNPLGELTALARHHGLRVCVDCISSLGSEEVDLRDVHFASGTSGKGLAGYPGLALVFHRDTPRPEPNRLPGYLDLGHWAAHDSVPHTHSSNLVHSLAAALPAITPARMTRIRANALWLRATLRALGFTPVAPDVAASPGVITLALDDSLSASAVGDALEARGYLLHFQSRHLSVRNWIQISLFGDPPRARLAEMVVQLCAARDRLRAYDCATPSLHSSGTEINELVDA